MPDTCQNVEVSTRDTRSSLKKQIMSAIFAVLLLIVLVSATRFKQGAYGPVIVQSLLLISVLWAVRTRQVGQLFDIFAPNSAAEAGANRLQFTVGKNNKTRYTLNWIGNLGITLACWTLVFGILWMVATNNSRSPALRFLTGNVVYPKFVLMPQGKIAVKNIIQENGDVFVNGVVEPTHGSHTIIVTHEGIHRIDAPHFVLLVLCTWLIWLLPCVFAIISLWVTQSRQPDRPDMIDYHGMALLAVCAVLGIMSLSIAEFWLGLNEEVGLGWSLAALTPIVGLTIRLFAPWRWTEGGKGVLNMPCECEGASSLDTLEFLESPIDKTEDGGSAEQQQAQGGGCREPNHNGPVVIVCASGGGSRAALFTADILNRMWWQNVPNGFLTREKQETLRQAARSVHQVGETDATQTPNSEHTPDSEPLADRKAAAEQTAQYPGRLLLQCMDAISSVSGGSLASAYFVESLHRGLRDQFPTDNAAWGRWRALNAFFDPKGLSSEVARPLTTWYAEMQTPASLKAFFECHNAALDAPRLGDNIEEWHCRFEANPFVNAMAQDHLAACISGFFVWRMGSAPDRDTANSRTEHFLRVPCYPIGRGPNIERFWEQQFSWYDYDKDTKKSNGNPVRLNDFLPKEMGGHLPSLVLNSTLVGTGTRLAITNLKNAAFKESLKFGPKVDANSLGGGNRQQEAHRFDPLPAQVNTLNALDNHWNIPLKSAVRASANFPFGFPLMRFRRYKAMPKDTNNQHVPLEILDICDGGLLDNTGVDTAMALVRANRKAIRQRGVLLFLIDSGELPRNPGLSLLDTLLYNLSAVRNGMWRTNLNAQAALHSGYLEELRALFESELEAKEGNEKGLKKMEAVHQPVDGKQYTLGYEGKNVAFYVVRAGELNQEHVMTSWHLDAGQRALLHKEAMKPQQGEAILRASQWFARRLLDNQLSQNAQRPASP